MSAMEAPAPCEIIEFPMRNSSGNVGRGGAATVAHVLFTQSKLDELHPGATLQIIQFCYNSGVAASAGTHDYDDVLDVRILSPKGRVWGRWKTQRFLRDWGWADWSRWWPLFSPHHHMVGLREGAVEYIGGVPHYGGCRIGEFVPGQISDYWTHKTGLKWHLPDPTYHPKKQFIFDYWKWVEDQMEYKDWSQESKDALVRDLLDTDITRSKDDALTFRQALIRASGLRDKPAGPPPAAERSKS